MASPITASSSIDVQGMVSNLMSFERKPLTQMQTEAKKIDTKVSAYGKLQSQVAAFRDASATLSRLETWRSVKAASADAASVEVTASAGAGASQHMVAVQQLAYASSAAIVGGGTVRIQLGTQPTGAASFTADAARPEMAVTVPAGATLAEVRDAINAAGAGVRASIVRDGDQVRLFVTGTDSGGNQAFRMQVDDADGTPTDAAGLSAIAFDPVAAAGAGRNLALVRQAVDSQYTIDGVALTGRSNRIAGAMDGIDLVLKKVTAAEVQVDVTVDAEALKTSTQKFVDTYNSLNKLLAEQTKYDETTKTAGPLQGDRTAVGILGQVRAIVRETVTGGTLSKLADVGITLQRDGSLALSSSAFASAAVDPSKLEKLFAAPGTPVTAPDGTVSTPDRGLMVRFKSLGDSLLASDGSVQTATDAWAARLKANKNRQAAFEVRMTDVEKRLLRQYSSLDAQLAAAQQSSSALASALSALPKT
jgi:flagellar hook-associated protein 2